MRRHSYTGTHAHSQSITCIEACATVRTCTYVNVEISDRRLINQSLFLIFFLKKRVLQSLILRFQIWVHLHPLIAILEKQ